MLEFLGLESLDALVDEAVPATIRMEGSLEIGPAVPEQTALTELASIAAGNEIFTSLIGMGYYDTVVPPVIQRNVLENPGWYTQYTPYQAEIAQGRMEALVNFQTVVADLTGLPMANASLLDEGTAAAEAVALCHAIGRGKKSGFFIVDGVHPQTVDVVQTRAAPVGFQLHSGPESAIDFEGQDLFGILLQYPATDGSIRDYRALISRAHDAGALVVVATDLLALTLLTPPGELGADVAIGSAQRFGVPMGAGGPHAAFMATREQHKRHLPGRIIGVSQDAAGRPAYRLALQTREQHIRRDKATSNICTAQVLLAIMASMYAVYHGPKGLQRIARRVHAMTKILAVGLTKLGFDLGDQPFFDTLRIRLDATKGQALIDAAQAQRINLRVYDGGDVGISLDERSGPELVDRLFALFNGGAPDFTAAALAESIEAEVAPEVRRTTEFLTHSVFNRYHSEHEMLRYLQRLQSRDLSLTHAMIPLGSCTMKLNSTSEMMPVTWPAFGQIHPFAPWSQQQGYVTMFRQLERWLQNITGFAAVSLQPNAGSQGEYTGLLTIRAYQRDRGHGHRNVCLIPTSAHGTNPASAVMAGMRVVAVKCDDQGNIDLGDLRAKAEKHSDDLAALMITYPSTHGVFETMIKEVNDVVHAHGGQVYLDGANMNAQVGLTRPGDYGADVCHLNLHKDLFAFLTAEGGRAWGRSASRNTSRRFLPGHAHIDRAADKAIGSVASAPYGSPSILPISWMYIRMMGTEGLTEATRLAILNANYMAKRLEGHFDILYRGNNGRVAHEFILDTRPFKRSAGIEVDDIAKRLMDFGFHAPTMSWPVAGTMMVEPTESESIDELDRFCDAMIAIREEIRAIETEALDRVDNPLKRAPHTADDICSESWDRPYSRQQAAFPRPWVKAGKFWPSVGRVDNAYGDRHLVCTCPPMDSYE